MWAKRRILDSLIFLCAVLLGLMVLRLAQPKIQDAFAEEAGGDYIKWVSFDIPMTALKAAMQAALDSKSAAVIDCVLNIDEMVRPMVSAGSAITDFLLD